MKTLKQRISPGLVVAVVALVVALAGTSIALPGRNSVDKRDLKKGAVTKRAIKKGAVARSKLANGSVGAAQLGPLTPRNAAVPVGAGQYAEVIASCGPGEKAIGGGVVWDNQGVNEFTPVLESHAEGNGWQVRVQNGFGQERTLTVQAYCLG